jgi:cation transport regulator ChaB
MPKTTSSGRPKQSELPSTLRRSSARAQRTFAKAHDRAVEQYGEGERAHRTAFAALKHSFKKVDGRWVEKDEKGPSDPRSKQPQERKRRGVGETFGGVDVEGSAKEELYRQARRAGIERRSRMSKRELARALARRG